MSILRLMLIACLLAAPAALGAQVEGDSAAGGARGRIERSEHPRRFQRMVVPAIVGSGVGLVAGAAFGAGPFYSATGCCGGGDDPGLTSGLVGAFAGATLGATLGAWITRTSDQPVSSSRAFVGATLGIGTGLLVGLAGTQIDPDDFRGLLVGFSIGQGGTAAAFAVPYP
ncbi:MAG TPA: hypothetical protein VFY65_03730 [Longimicrobium sp.]|nr:hypothetical protein [Longimicrobium sp.]